MKILILGGDGMLGHTLLKHFKDIYTTKVTLRQGLDAYLKYGNYNNENSFFNINITNFNDVENVLNNYKPNVVINAVGIVKQRADSKEIIPSIEINALFPHKLAEFCKNINARVFHISTDCVYTGEKGMYKEIDNSDATDIYGKTKFLGELHDSHCITLRTSIIGRELSRHTSLLDWFLSQNGKVSGYKNAIFSGFTTIELSRVIHMLIEKYPNASGLYHVSSDPINKYDLLKLISEKLNHKIEILPNEEFKCDRSLNSDIFRKEFNYQPPSWESMIETLSKEE